MAKEFLFEYQRTEKKEDSRTAGTSGFSKYDRFKKEVILKSLKKVQTDDSMPFSKSLICDIVFTISNVPFFLSIQADFMQQE